MALLFWTPETHLLPFKWTPNYLCKALMMLADSLPKLLTLKGRIVKTQTELSLERTCPFLARWQRTTLRKIWMTGYQKVQARKGVKLQDHLCVRSQLLLAMVKRKTSTPQTFQRTAITTKQMCVREHWRTNLSVCVKNAAVLSDPTCSAPALLCWWWVGTAQPFAPETKAVQTIQKMSKTVTVATATMSLVTSACHLSHQSRQKVPQGTQITPAAPTVLMGATFLTKTLLHCHCQTETPSPLLTSLPAVFIPHLPPLFRAQHLKCVPASMCPVTQRTTCRARLACLPHSALSFPPPVAVGRVDLKVLRVLLCTQTMHGHWLFLYADLPWAMRSWWIPRSWQKVRLDMHSR